MLVRAIIALSVFYGAYRTANSPDGGAKAATEDTTIICPPPRAFKSFKNNLVSIITDIPNTFKWNIFRHFLA